MNKLKQLFTSTISKYTRVFGQLALSRGSQGFDLNLKWLIKDLFPLMSFGMIYGPSGSFKSFLAIDLTCSIATGLPWNGKRVRKGAVLYIAAEGQLGISRRIKAWEIANGVQANDVFILGHSLYVAEEHAQKAAIDAIQEIKTQTGLNVEMIVIDTLARCYTGDENTATDMAKFIAGCDTIRAATNASVLCIHHSGRDERKGARGSSALRAACDYEFQVKRTGKAKLLTFINTKQKDGDEAPDLTFELDTVDLGIICEEQLPISSLARTRSASIKSSKETEKRDPILELLISSFGGKTTHEELRLKLFPDTEKLTDAQRKKFSRSLRELESTGKISIEKSSPKRASGTDVINLTH